MPGMAAEDTAAAMSAAAGAVSWGEVTQAVRDAQMPAGACSEGDWLGIVGGDVTTISTDLQSAATRVLDALVDDDSEVVTIVTGAEADDAGAKALIDHLEENHPGVEVTVITGGQPLYPYLFGVE
jgi:hypothetical protein